MTSATASAEFPVTVVFPGQGCQRPGMGRDFHDRFRSSRLAFEEASDASGLDLRILCFEQDPRLPLTEYSQPAIVATEIAMLRGLAEGWGLIATRFGGHSLGEYSALVAAGVLALADAVRIVRERGRLMQAAVPVGHGAMLAVLGETLDRQAIDGCLAGLRVTVANDNSEDQLVLSGPILELREVARRISQYRAGWRTVELEVSAPFHSWMMAPIEPAFREVLGESSAQWNTAGATCVTSNLTGGFHDADEGLLCDRLVGQLSGSVRWRDNMTALASGSSAIFEVGPGRPLRGFFRTIGAEVVSVVDARSAERALQARAAA